MRLIRSKNRFFTNVLQVIRGTAIAQAIMLAVTPFLTRLFSPEAFGELVTYQAILAFGLVGCAFRYEYAVLLPEEDEVAHDLVLIGLLVAALVALTMLAAIGISIGSLGNVSSVLQSVLLFVPFALLLGGWVQILNFLALREKNFRVTANAKIIRSVSLSLVSLIGGYLRPTGATLMLADVLSRLMSLALLWAQLSQKVIDHLRKSDVSRLLATARRYRAFPKISLPSSMINTAAINLTPLMMAANFGLVTAGLYALVDRVFGAPSALIGTAVGQVYMAELAEKKRDSPHKVEELFVKVTLSQAKIAIVPIVVVVMIAPDVFSIVFGELWRESGVYARYLALLYFLGFVFTPIGATLTVLEHQDWQLLWDTSRLAVILLTWALIHLCELSPEVGLLLYSLTVSAFIVIYLALCMGSFRRLRQGT